ncbi:MAG: hypothetical protein A3G25_05330 [Betaproteobacteria bacterium RIFCSPLOWO2_12_FULL_63_13]|nr:MAG: hypothetical protein A3G25_05330 [Betaproteobacteria bacterium RIFCSPLOWO2_12_FULL_63_13]
MNRRAAGFTLIELLVAITLASLVALLGALVLRTAIDFHERATRHIREREDLRAADRLLLHEWSGRRAQGVLASANEIEFQTDRLAGPYAAGEAGEVRVRYLCSRSDDGQVALERLLLARAEAQPGGARDSRSERVSGKNETWRVLHSEILVPQLLACRFAYLEPREERDARIAQWRAEIAEAEPPPRLLRLTLATARGDIAPLVYGADG